MNKHIDANKLESEMVKRLKECGLTPDVIRLTRLAWGTFLDGESIFCVQRTEHGPVVSLITVKPLRP